MIITGIHFQREGRQAYNTALPDIDYIDGKIDGMKSDFFHVIDFSVRF